MSMVRCVLQFANWKLRVYAIGFTIVDKVYLQVLATRWSSGLRPRCSAASSYDAVHRILVPRIAEGQATRRAALLSALGLASAALSRPLSSAAAEQGIQPSDYTVPALPTQGYVEKIKNLRGQAWRSMRVLANSGRYMELSNSLVLGPIDDIRQSVLYIPSALLKEGKRQEAISSRKAYTEYVRELKRLDDTLQKAARYDADDEDVADSIARLSKRLDDVLNVAA